MILLNIFVYVGMIAAAISGALLGIKKRLDFFGIIVLGLSTALGGGIIRDILIGFFPPVAFREPIYTVVGTAAAVLVMFFPKKFADRTNAINFFDAVGLAAFTAVGADIALKQPITSTFIIVTIGVITGIGGGIIRDIFAQEIPLIFQKEVYATASIAGAAALALSQCYLGGTGPLYICFLTTLIIRLTAMYLGIHKSGPPRAKDKPYSIDS